MKNTTSRKSNKSICCLLAACAGTLLLSSSVFAIPMAHWAFLRSPGGEVLATLNPGDEVEVIGISSDLSYRTDVYSPAGDLYGSVGSVYIYGGSEYEYENPLVYDYTGTYEEATANAEQPDPLLENARESAQVVIEGLTALGAPLPEASSEKKTEENGETAGEKSALSSFVPGGVYSGTEEEAEAHFQDVRNYYLNSDEVWVDVDLYTQWLVLYRGSEVLLSVPCTTGNYTVTDTPRGEFPIIYKTTDTYLTGDNPDGTYYSRYVNYWMVLTEWGIGMHDSPWRDDFGGDIYFGNGTLGCVCMDTDNAAFVYDHVQEGTVVVIH